MTVPASEALGWSELQQQAGSSQSRSILRGSLDHLLRLTAPSSTRYRVNSSRRRTKAASSSVTGSCRRSRVGT